MRADVTKIEAAPDGTIIVGTGKAAEVEAKGNGVAGSVTTTAKDEWGNIQ